MDLTSGRRPKWVARYEKWMGGPGGGGCECPLKTILPNFGLGRSPNSFALLKSLSQYHTVRIKAVDNGAGAVTLKHPKFFGDLFFFLTMFIVICN